MYLVICKCVDDGKTSSNSGISSDSVAIVGGAVGAVMLLLMIIEVLCIVILCMRRCDGKGDDRVPCGINKLNTDVSMEYNPSYDVTEASTVDYSYDTNNPGGSDVPITANPSYNVHTKPYSKTSEDDYNYVQPNEPMQHSDVDGYIKMYPSVDQSHGIRGIHLHSTVNSPKHGEYVVVNQP